MEKHTETKLPLPANRWVNVDEALKIIRDTRWCWARNSECKYIKLWVDTRDGHCIISDRNGKEITLRELSRQCDEYLIPSPPLKIVEENACNPKEG